MLKFKFSGEFEVDPTKLEPIYENGHLVGFRGLPKEMYGFSKPVPDTTITNVGLGVRWTWPGGQTSGVSDSTAECGIVGVKLVVEEG